MNNLIKKLVPPISERKFNTSFDFIEIDITYACNLKCNNCNRSCNQAPDNIYITTSQVHKFIKQTKNSKRKFKRIRLLGGEPMLHPDIFNIMDLLLEFRRSESPKTIIEISTNGYGNKVKEGIEVIPEGIEITNTYKTPTNKEIFEPFNLAPCDIMNFVENAFTNACWITRDCGIGLNMYGYYHCAVAAAIDRVFGYNIGLRNLPESEEVLFGQKKLLCGYCGHFLNRKKVHTKDRKQISGKVISSSWESAYERYKYGRPKMTRF